MKGDGEGCSGLSGPGHTWHQGEGWGGGPTLGWVPPACVAGDVQVKTPAQGPPWDGYTGAGPIPGGISGFLPGRRQFF